MRPESPVAIESLRPVSSGALVWRRSGRLSLTIVVKATLRLVNDGAAQISAPIDLCHGERAPRLGVSIVADSDIVPYKPRVDVTYVGSAWAPRPVQGLRARIAVHGGGGVLEKAVQVVGERHSMTAQPSPFVRMPVVFERAWVGAHGENPLGVPLHSGRIANLFDPTDPSKPACFAPISRAFPVRQRLLGSLDTRSLETPSPDPTGVWAIDIPGNLPFDYFLSSPPDQRIDLLTGNETLLLENLIEGQSRLHTRLPAIKALAKVFGATLPPQGQAIDLIGDTLAIDGSDQTVSITWRGTIPVPGTENLLRSLHVLTGIESTGYPMQWPSPSLSSTVDLPRGAARRIQTIDIAEEPTPMLDDEPSGSTQAISPEQAMKLLAGAKKALPFGGKSDAPAPLEPPPGHTERTLSPDEASALANKLTEQMPKGSEPPPPLRRPASAGRGGPRSARGSERPAPGQAPQPPPPQAPPPQPPPPQPPPAQPPPPQPVPQPPPLISKPAPVATGAPPFPPPAFGAAGKGGTNLMPPTNPVLEQARAQRRGPDLIVRAPGFDPSANLGIEDEDSSIGSTVAFTPEAAAELIARRVAQSAAEAPKKTGGTTAIPAVPAPVAARPPMPAPIDDDPVDSSVGSTMAFSPEAAAELIAQRMGRPVAPVGPGLPPPGPPPLAVPPAPPPPGPAPTGPTLTRSNTLVMDAPTEASTKDTRKSR